MGTELSEDCIGLEVSIRFRVVVDPEGAEATDTGDDSPADTPSDEGSFAIFARDPVYPAFDLATVGGDDTEGDGLLAVSPSVQLPAVGEVLLPRAVDRADGVGHIRLEVDLATSSTIHRGTAGADEGVGDGYEEGED